MSQFTAPFTRPSLYEPPRPNSRHPLTPPDTDFDYTLPQPHPIVSAPAGLGIDLEPPMAQLMNTMLGTATPPTHRKGPSVTYINSSMRESRERVVQRGMKWLVMVTPPASFTHEHGYLGNALSSGPSHRLPQGILMPLYPSMGSQLGAIAREFSLPSIAGLCLYLHTTAAGVIVTPRISEESWSILWGPYLDNRNALPSQSQPQLPLCGQIDFDIDMNKARWYDAWLAAPRRDVQDVPVSVSRPPSHWRGDSRTTFLEDQADDLDTISLIQQGRTRTLGRNAPKKLSLVDRFELSSTKSASKRLPRNFSPTETEDALQRQQSLSPIAQEDEPRSARKTLDQLITTWRESASQIAASPLAATGQTSLDPANLPNNFPLNQLALDAEAQSELNLDDFQWSVSSVGPPEYEDDFEDEADWEYDPSVHLAHRLQGSVCLTPTTVSSFGPPDYDVSSPISNVSRLPSPDVALRMLDDCPPTPSVCTSWGPPSYPNSPLPYESRAPSVDLGHRGTYSRPVTPSTATTWGPLDSYPASPMGSVFSGVRTPDAGERCLFEGLQVPQVVQQVWKLVWPYYREPEADLPEPWSHVWPYIGNDKGTEAVQRRSYGTYPYLTIYPAVYPAFDLYPNLIGTVTEHKTVESVPLGVGYPSFNLYPPVYPYLDIYPGPVTFVYQERETSSERSSLNNNVISCAYRWSYPAFEIYPAVYPWNLNIVYSPPTVVSTEVVVGLEFVYPAVSIYSSVYPHNLDEIYPSKIAQSWHSKAWEATYGVVSVDVALASQYPVLDIYPALHPFSLSSIYPSTHLAKTPPMQDAPVVTRLTVQYPTFNLYPSYYPHNLAEVYPSTRIADSPAGAFIAVPTMELRISKPYPSFEIYAPVYPWNVQSIYDCPSRQVPATVEEVVTRDPITLRLPPSYPTFILYPAVYPLGLLELYPSSVAESPISDAQQVNGEVESYISVALSALYPAIDLYAPVYPYNLEAIYPVKVGSMSKRLRSKRTLSSNNALPFQPRGMRPNKHTSLLLFGQTAGARTVEDVPPVPKLPENIHQLRPISPWTGLPLREEVSGKMTGNEVSMRYPTICLYPAVYPHFVLYPSLGEHTMTPVHSKLDTGTTKMEPRYPFLQIYSAVYPFIELYPACAQATKPIHSPPAQQSKRHSRIPRKPRKHTHNDLYIQVFGKSPPPSPRQLPTPPGPAMNPASIAPRQIPPVRMSSRSKSDTGSSRASPPPPLNGFPRRQLPTPPGGGSVSPLAMSPNATRTLSPRQFSGPGTTRIPSPSPRPSPLSSPLPPVSELSVSPTPSPTRPSPTRRVPAQLNLQGSIAYRSPSLTSTSLPGSAASSPNESAIGLSRTMSVSSRPLPRARSGSIAMGYARAPLPPVPDAPPAALPSCN